MTDAAQRALRSLHDCGIIRIRRSTQAPYAELVRAKVARVIRRDPDNKWADIALRHHEHRSAFPPASSDGAATWSKPPVAARSFVPADSAWQP